MWLHPSTPAGHHTKTLREDLKQLHCHKQFCPRHHHHHGGSDEAIPSPTELAKMSQCGRRVQERLQLLLECGGGFRASTHGPHAKPLPYCVVGPQRLVQCTYHNAKALSPPQTTEDFELKSEKIERAN